ncbi:MAG: GGDEF domain-containing phosphodiesterase [Vallitalea sp.]|jgi:diguanylate cyclase (GGDEF)-like protein|nr:GGDEF domain-containing phosphodiesterase [Vallitalea sp.]
MKTYKLIYKDLKQIQSFIKYNNIDDSSNLLIQIFSNTKYDGYIDIIMDNLLNLCPNSHILGAINTKLEQDIPNETIISFTILKNIHINLSKLDNFSDVNLLSNTLDNVVNDQTQLIVFFNNSHMNIDSFLDKLDLENPSLIITGVKPSDESDLYIFTNNSITTDGLLVVSFDNIELDANTYINYLIDDYENLLINNHNKIMHTIDSNSTINFYEKYETQVICRLFHKVSEQMYSINKKLHQQVIDTTTQLFEQYYIDSLTKLYNVNKFNENLENENIYSLALIDIRSFISINNFYGSKIGDNILVELATIIKEYTSVFKYVCHRIYSDIFAIISRDSEEDFQIFINHMNKLQEKINNHCFLEDNYKIYINTTVALCENNSFKLASMSLEYAKSRNKSFIIYDKELHIEKKIENNLIWVSKIIDAIKNDRIIPFFQPIWNNTTEKYDKFEVLMRMIDTDGEIILPDKFIHIAKKSNLYNQLTKIIIDKSFATFKNTNYDFSVNISADDIIDEETREYIYNKLRTSTCSSHVIFELVESESIENYDQVVDFIDNVKSYGAEVAIDDFGTGFSNFHYLFKLNISCIKLDGSIIENIANDKACELVAETIIGFARKMNITTIAEYVSNKDIYDKIKQLGIDFSQGYYFSKPVDNINILTEY